MQSPTRPTWIARAVRYALLILVVASSALVPVAPADAAPERTARPASSAAACPSQPFSGIRTIGTRAYSLYVPSGLTGARPLILNLHGGGIPAVAWQPETRMDQAADRHGFIVAYPQGDALSFWDSASASSGDTQFLRDVVEDISQTWCVDPRHVHITGGSMGGWMAQRMMCHSADMFASGAAGAAGHPALDEANPFADPTPMPCQPSRPVSVLLSIGDEDGYYLDGRYALGVAEWVADQSCPAPTYHELPGGSMDLYQPCDAGTTIISRILEGVGHDVPSHDVLDRSNDEMFLFFQANPRPF